MRLVNWISTNEIEPVNDEAYFLADSSSDYITTGHWKADQEAWLLDNTVDNYFEKTEYEFCILQRDVISLPGKVGPITLTNDDIMKVCEVLGTSPAELVSYATKVALVLNHE